MALSKATLNELRGKYGSDFELWWLAIFGFGLGELTEAEANYLIRAESFDNIRNKLIEAAQQKE